MKKAIIFLSIILLSIALVAQKNGEKKQLETIVKLENREIMMNNNLDDYLADESGKQIKRLIGTLVDVNMVESYVVSNRIPDAKGIYYDEPRWKHEVRFLLRLEFAISIKKEYTKRHFVIFYLTGTGIWEIGREFFISVHPDGIVTIELMKEKEK